MTPSTQRLALMLSLLAIAWPTHAQDAEPPPALLEPPAAAQGYYFSLGVNGGLATIEDDGETLDPLGGYAFSLHIGQEIVRWMDLGIALELGSIASEQRTGSLFSFGIEWTLRPVTEVFVRLGGGIGVSGLSAAESSDNDADAFGAIAAVTVGYAWFPFREPRDSGGFSISPVLRIVAVQPLAEDAAYWTTAGFEFAIWTGLPKRQLDMPLEEAFPAAK